MKKATTCDFCRRHCGVQYKFDLEPLKYIVVGAGCLKKIIVNEWNNRHDGPAILKELQEYLPPASSMDGQYKQSYRAVVAKFEQLLERLGQ